MTKQELKQMSENKDKITLKDDKPKIKMAKCSACNETVISHAGLPFFKEDESVGMDEFYCGCRGWD